MTTETQARIIVLQLTDELLAQLQPFLAELDITATATQCLTMRGDVYATLAARVGGALDYEVCWQPNEYEPDGFVERVRPLELMGRHPHAGELPAVRGTRAGQPPGGCVRVRPGGRLGLASTPGRPDTPVSGRLLLCAWR
jgi:hypothetical protein